jgi:hypothetical protein
MCISRKSQDGRSPAKLLTHDETWRIAANIAKLPQGAAAEATGVYRPHFRYDLNSRHFAGLRSLTSWLLHFASAFSRWLRAMS